MNASTCTYYQGIWDFPDFRSYLCEWVIPYMVKDLETVFEGAKNRWKELGCSEAGRGDFILSTALFTLFDHLGSFMGNVNDSLSPRENISRCARRLESTKGVDLIVGHFGRNALVHRAWPQTVAAMDNRSWAFGLNVTANPDESDHRKLYWRKYQLPDEAGDPTTIPVLKLRLNVGVLRRELEGLLMDQKFPSSVRPEVFRRVQNNAIRCCNEPFAPPEGLLNGRGLGRSWQTAVERQIRALYQQAKTI